MHQQRRNQSKKKKKKKYPRRYRRSKKKAEKKKKSLKIIEGEQVVEGHPKAILWRRIIRAWKYAHAVWAHILEMFLYPS